MSIGIKLTKLDMAGHCSWKKNPGKIAPHHIFHRNSGAIGYRVTVPAELLVA
jgi:hypothetical protein